MEKGKPTTQDMLRRIDAMEASIHRMMSALKEDLDSLREDLTRLETARPSPQRSATPPPRSAVKRTISEEVAAQAAKKRDPRSD